MSISFFKVLGKYIGVILASSINLASINNDDISVVEEKKVNTNIVIERKEENKDIIVSDKPEKAIINETNNNNILNNTADNKVLETFVGTITGYGPDCYGCSGEGYLACRVKDGSKHSLKYNDVYYEDEEYGKIQILAAATNKFPCGTIIEVNTQLNKFIGIVLDTGGTMRNAWNERSEVWMDLAFATEAEAGEKMPLSKNIVYNVLRYGWE